MVLDVPAPPLWVFVLGSVTAGLLGIAASHGLPGRIALGVWGAATMGALYALTNPDDTED